jgi:photosystem II stability/assembly factor-like uncharacterized protein
MRSLSAAFNNSEDTMKSKRDVCHLVVIIGFSLLFCHFASAEYAASTQQNPIDETILNNMKWRCIGPANPGGRIDDFAVVEGNPRIIYAATASGGVWKTTNNGVTWNPIFDDYGSSSIGDITLSASNPDIVWVGTGEPNNRQSSSWGDGVYRSTDEGRTWKNMGLSDTHHIGRIAIHPKNPDIVYVAALGHLWGPNEERGLFRTMDGGLTWSKILYIDENTGCVDVAMNPDNPLILYAAAYQRRRSGWGFNGGGPGSGLFRTADGGETWTRLSNGLPTGQTGRIGIDVYRNDPHIVYAIIEHKEGGVFRSEDNGFSWKRMSEINPRPMYYSKIRIDPNNDLRIWVLGSQMFFSEDGGKSWDTERIARTVREKRAVHGDHHAMWIDPSDSDHMILGSDGGIYFSYDRGLTWDFIDTLPLAQVYEVSYDMRKPYYVIGGLQDNGSWQGPSAAWFRPKITNDEWFRVGGADGFYSQVDPEDYTRVYSESQNGGIERLDLNTGEYKSIRPVPKDPSEIIRFNWNSPFLMSSHDSNSIYLGGNKLFISENGGETWMSTIDLTSQIDREKLPLMGVLPDESTLSKHDGILFYGTITTIAESPLQKGLLYVGTDDGNLQVTKDGGETWKNITTNIPEIPERTYISRIEASHHDLGTAYVTLDGHRNDDFKAYVFMSDDFGESWTDISSNLPEGGTLSVVREHHRNPNLLFVGTERGAYFSVDKGKKWIKFTNDFPVVPVDDIAIHPRDNDLIFGTHGRSIWILDDITPLEQMSGDNLESAYHLFDIQPATLYNFFSRRAHYDFKGLFGHKVFRAPNPPYGVIISYYLKQDSEENVRIIIQDEDSGQTIRELQGARTAGINRVIWDLRHGYPASHPPAKPEMKHGPSVLPGHYDVILKCGEFEMSKKVEVELDQALTVSFPELKARHDALIEIYRLNPILQELRKTSESIKMELKTLKSKLEDIQNIPDVIREKIDTIHEEIEKIRFQVYGSPDNPNQRRYFSIVSLQRIATSLERFTEAPSPSDQEFIRKKSGELRTVIESMNRVLQLAIPELNTLLIEHKIPQLTLREAIKGF